MRSRAMASGYLLLLYLLLVPYECVYGAGGDDSDERPTNPLLVQTGAFEMEEEFGDQLNRPKGSVGAPQRTAKHVTESFFTRGSHTNNWAVLVCTSRFWFNYRHMANALSMYRVVRNLGIPDSNIILMLADDAACNPRNPCPAEVFNKGPTQLEEGEVPVNIYGESIEVDYRGYEVTVENFVRLMTGRHNAHVPRSKRLLSDDRSNILVYMTGHGGDEFLKFQDYDEIQASAIADVFEQMYEQKRYNEVLFVVDTCQAATMYKKVYSPNVIGMSSSLLGESSYSAQHDSEIGVGLIDRFTASILEFFLEVTGDANISQLFEYFDPRALKSTADLRSDLFVNRPVETVRLTDFFGSVLSVEYTEYAYGE